MRRPAALLGLLFATALACSSRPGLVDSSPPADGWLRPDAFECGMPSVSSPVLESGIELVYDSVLQTPAELQDNVPGARAVFVGDGTVDVLGMSAFFRLTPDATVIVRHPYSLPGASAVVYLDSAAERSGAYAVVLSEHAVRRAFCLLDPATGMMAQTCQNVQDNFLGGTLLARTADGFVVFVSLTGHLLTTEFDASGAWMRDGVLLESSRLNGAFRPAVNVGDGVLLCLSGGHNLMGDASTTGCSSHWSMSLGPDLGFDRSLEHDLVAAQVEAGGECVVVPGGAGVLTIDDVSCWRHDCQPAGSLVTQARVIGQDGQAGPPSYTDPYAVGNGFRVGVAEGSGFTILEAGPKETRLALLDGQGKRTRTFDLRLANRQEGIEIPGGDAAMGRIGPGDYVFVYRAITFSGDQTRIARFRLPAGTL